MVDGFRQVGRLRQGGPVAVTRVTLKIEDVFGELPVLESGRLILRQMEVDDAPGLFEYCSDRDLLRHLPLEHTATLEDAVRCIQNFRAMYAAKKLAPWGVTLKETGKHIGICGFESWNPFADRAEIGFVITRRYWRQGLATEAATRVMRFGFEKMNLHRIEARAKRENESSTQLLKKMGFQYEGYLREQGYWMGAYHNLEFYSILRDEFYAVQR